MAKPKSIIKEEQEADALIAAANDVGQQDPSVATVVTTDPTSDPGPVDTGDPTAIPVVAVDEGAQPDAWKHKYDVLQGKYNAEIPRLNSEVRLLKADRENQLTLIQELRAQITSMFQSYEAGKTPPGNKGADVDPTTSLDEEFSPEFVAKMRGLFRKELDSSIKPYNDKVANLEASQGRNEQDRYFGSLTSAIPDWRDVNSDPEFGDWLRGNREQLSGISYWDILQNANHRFDSPVAINVLKVYKKYQQDKSNPTPPGNESNLEHLISPNKTKTTILPKGNAKPIVPLAQIEKFYDDVRRGKYRDKEEEAKRLDEYYSEAVAAGRVA